MKKLIAPLSVIVFVAVLSMLVYTEETSDNQLYSSSTVVSKIEFVGSGSPNCGPLMMNQAGTYFCCDNTNEAHCYAAACP